ncbi:SagB/ThcOx family dehydrogenase [Mycobacterium simiae]|uniref:SagB/ThcOx family dehydrogenase n=1 Tax=Mycobacterium simiae TaxID=1784 RepID=A0A5B1BPQ8_MYCSI|nr:SagB family peptide dehydrogenase [Mycobacterium simiae]KAA1249194.1 SagB/ThcOx family dehydrogenase [Mycobacterium simiae]
MKDSATRYERSPHLLLEWEPGKDGATVFNPDARRTFRVDAALVNLLGHLNQPLTVSEIGQRWKETPSNDRLAGLLSQLTDAGLVRTSAPSWSARAVTAPAWTACELAVHWQAGRGPQADARFGEPPPARLNHPEATAIVALPDGDPALPSHPLAELFTCRRSIRRYARQPLPLSLLAALLHRAARVQRRENARDERGTLGEVTQRPAPSGGARHSLEIYLVARDIAGLATGAYHYDPFDHALHQLGPWTSELEQTLDRTTVQAAQMNAPPPASLYLASYAARTTWKYQGMALSLIYRDAGCLLQTLTLAATDVGLASCITARLEAPITAPFLRGRDQEFVHAGNLALGLPCQAPT